MSLTMKHRSPVDVKWREPTVPGPVESRRFVRSLDHLIRPPQQRRRDCQPERLGGLEVDHQLELRGLLDGQVAGLGTLENLAYVGRGAPPHIRNLRAIGHKAPSIDKIPEWEHCR